MAVTHATRLGCGRDVDDVWATVDAPPSPHEQSCTYCQAARASLAELSAATRELVTADREDPLLRVPAQLLADVLTIARTEVRRGRTIPLQRPVVPAGETGTHAPAEAGVELTISEQAIATVVRQASDAFPGVEAQRCRIEVAASPGPEVAPAERADDAPPDRPVDITVDLQVSVSRRSAISSLADLRRAIAEAVLAQVGVTVSRVDIHVQDVHDA